MRTVNRSSASRSNGSRICASSAAAASMSTISPHRHAACGDPRSSVAHGRIRSIDVSRRGKNLRRARRHHRGRSRRFHSAGADAAAAAAGVRALRSAGHRARQGALCRRADRRGAGRERRRCRGRARTRSRSISSRCRPSRPGEAPRKDEALLFEDNGTNVTITFRAVPATSTAAFADAPYTRRERFSVQRHTALPMEPRGVLAEWDAASGR